MLSSVTWEVVMAGGGGAGVAEGAGVLGLVDMAVVSGGESEAVTGHQMCFKYLGGEHTSILLLLSTPPILLLLLLLLLLVRLSLGNGVFKWDSGCR
jgi:hypothetical protein